MLTQKNVFNSVSVLVSLTSCLVFSSCSKKDDSAQKMRDEVIQAESKSVPKAMKLSEVTASEYKNILKELYNEGCVEAGSEKPNFKLHPKLAAGQTVVIQNTEQTKDTKFSMRYDLKIQTAHEQNILLAGSIQDASLAGYAGLMTEKNSKAVQKSCSLLGEGTKTEVCYDLSVPYTEDFIKEYNHKFKNDKACSLSDEGSVLSEVSSLGEYTLEDGQKIKVLVKSKQTAYQQSCADQKESTAVVKTEITATSNDIVANRFSYCGGDIVYKKSSLRKDKDGELISQSDYLVKLAPVIEKPKQP